MGAVLIDGDSMKKLIAVALCVAVAGCGTYPLGNAYPLHGETRDQLRLAVLDCQDRAKNEANTSGRVAASFVAGLTIIGAPIAIAEERRKTREVWRDCMNEKGYRVIDPDGAVTEPKAAPAPAIAVGAPPAAVAPSKDTASQLQKLEDLRTKGLINEDEYKEKRKEILAGF